MLDTSRIQSGFDAELQLGGPWFLTAIQGAIKLPGGISITNVDVIDDPHWHLEMQTNSDDLTIKAKVEIKDNKIVFTTDFHDYSFEIDMPNFDGLDGTPELARVIGSGGFENAMSLLFNFEIHAVAQDQNPDKVHLGRGNKDYAVSFLPSGQHIAFGLARETFKRFANHIWHAMLRAPDGSHPLPPLPGDMQGEWEKVKVSVTKERIKYTLEGTVPIDLWPDPQVTAEIELKPKLENGELGLSSDVDLDADTGFWGAVLGFTAFALFGFLLNQFTGGLVMIPQLGGLEIIFLEVVLYWVAEKEEPRIKSMIVVKDSSGHQLTYQTCDEKIIKLAFPKDPDPFIIDLLLENVNTAIPVSSDTGDPLFTRSVALSAYYDEITLDGTGLAVAGKSGHAELLQPQVATLVESIYEQDDLKELKYTVPSSGNEVTLDLGEVLDRLAENELRPPVKTESVLADPELVIPSGKICCPCLIPTHIRRKDTVITRIKFDTGLELNTSDAVRLQDNAGVYLKGLQLIHPSNANPYFRSPPNETKVDNLEELPEF